jgi:myxalamid-type polyketide synthase MxaE and MxaD
MESSRALAALEAIAGRQAQIAIASIDWTALRALYEARRARPFFSKVAIEAPTGPARAAAAAGNVIDELAALPPYARRDALVSMVAAHVARILGIETGPAGIDVDRGLFEMGMDSLMSVEVKGSLERAVGQRLPSTLTFNYPTVRALSTFLWDQFLTAEDGPDSQAEIPVAAPLPSAPTQAVEVEELDDLSEDELEAMLASRLGAAR